MKKIKVSSSRKEQGQWISKYRRNGYSIKPGCSYPNEKWGCQYFFGIPASGKDRVVKSDLPGKSTDLKGLKNTGYGPSPDYLATFNHLMNCVLFPLTSIKVPENHYQLYLVRRSDTWIHRVKNI